LDVLQPSLDSERGRQIVSVETSIRSQLPNDTEIVAVRDDYEQSLQLLLEEAQAAGLGLVGYFGQVSRRGFVWHDRSYLPAVSAGGRRCAGRTWVFRADLL
jgi:hypothetical protein